MGIIPSDEQQNSGEAKMNAQGVPGIQIGKERYQNVPLDEENDRTLPISYGYQPIPPILQSNSSGSPVDQGVRRNAPINSWPLETNFQLESLLLHPWILYVKIQLNPFKKSTITTKWKTQNFTSWSGKLGSADVILKAKIFNIKAYTSIEIEDKTKTLREFVKYTVVDDAFAINNSLRKNEPRIDKLVRRTTMVATVTASYFLLTADYSPEPNVLDPIQVPLLLLIIS
uniref:Uncharacterized protein LOC104218514 n=1 Tax=Nicotiana sylvestris TaxID=4096 RepID=A0A1U7VY66_NICSY|nr:PREDICTED: uncharacterized protein LOC104218514 [Nicotiana sylvestris]